MYLNSKQIENKPMSVGIQEWEDIPRSVGIKKWEDKPVHGH